MSWSPTFEELTHQSRYAPKIIQKQVKQVKKNKQINKSLCSDVMFLSNGKFLTSKHCAVGLGLRSLTGLKQPVVYLSKLRHSVSYKQMEEIQTAQTELALNLSNESSILLLLPMDSNKKVNNYTFNGFKIWMKKYMYNYYKGTNVYLTCTIIFSLILNGLLYSLCLSTSETFLYLYFVSNFRIITKFLKSLEYFWK